MFSTLPEFIAFTLYAVLLLFRLQNFYIPGSGDESEFGCIYDPDYLVQTEFNEIIYKGGHTIASTRRYVHP